MTVFVGDFATCQKKLCLSAALLLTVLGGSWCQSSVSIEAVVPADHNVIGEDQYVCFRVDLPRESLKIVGVDPLSTQDVVHHMLLFGMQHHASLLLSTHAAMSQKHERTMLLVLCCKPDRLQ